MTHTIDMQEVRRFVPCEEPVAHAVQRRQYGLLWVLGAVWLACLVRSLGTPWLVAIGVVVVLAQLGIVGRVLLTLLVLIWVLAYCGVVVGVSAGWGLLAGAVACHGAVRLAQRDGKQ